MMGRNLKSRVIRLEDQRNARARPPYVHRVSEPPTVEELAAIEAAKSAGHRFIIVPWPCSTIEEWLATHGPADIRQ